MKTQKNTKTKKVASTKSKIGNNFVVAPTQTVSTKKAKVIKPKQSALLSAIKVEDNKTLTENGAPTFKSTLNANVDFFALGSALRTRSEAEINKLFVKAFTEDSLLAMKNLFHSRNIRGGQGERRSFRAILKELGDSNPDVVKKNLSNVALFGRFDDIFALVGTRSEKAAFEFLRDQLDKDVSAYEQDKGISLLAKWLPSENTSSAETRSLAHKFRSFLGWTPKQYRKTLSTLRSYSNVLEVKLCSNQWGNINYESVPSKANLLYRKAFGRHDQERYAAYLAAVNKGEKKINASALYPYEIYDKAHYSHDESAEVLWKNLPNYLEGNDRNILVMADVSGSMSGRPMSVSVSLAIYTAERNKGAFANHYLTFSSHPVLQKLQGNTLNQKIRFVENTNVGYDTNIQAAFDLILDTAKRNNLKQSDLPEQIIIVSDMEFNSSQNGGKTNHQTIVEKYAKFGYKAPSLVYWNVNSRQNNVPATANDQGVLLVSGCSPSIFKTLLSGTQHTPVDQMLETLNQEMYNVVKA